MASENRGAGGGLAHGVGVVWLGRSGRARVAGSGNDILLAIGGYNPGNTFTRRKVLP